jgi:hypothetical protein
MAIWYFVAILVRFSHFGLLYLEKSGNPVLGAKFAAK